MRTTPFFDPEASLGWRNGPLDGLSCLLRCVEATLRSEGFSNHEIACALARPVDLAGGRREPDFRHGELRWRNAVDGAEHWGELRAVVESGRPVTLMPDRFYWPGDEFEGKEHFLDHMVLVFSFDGTTMRALDTDAPAQERYTRTIPITDSVVHSACRWTTVHFDRPQETLESLRTTLLEPMARWLAEDLAGLHGISRRWEETGLTGPVARALHVLVLGELQPNLFTTATAVGEFFPAVAVSAFRAAEKAQALGKLLIGAHRFGGDRPLDVGVYQPVFRSFGPLVSALTELTDVLHRELGLVRPAARERSDVLWQRINGLRDWCYADAVAAPRFPQKAEERG